MGFTKLDSRILDSSVWFEPIATRIVWITFLAKCDKDGYVNAIYDAIMRDAGVGQDEFDIALKTLESPDPKSRSKENEGRRIEKVEGGWIVLNYKKYREKTYSDNPDAIRQREHRKSVTSCDMSQKSVTSCDNGCDISASASAYEYASESESDTTSNKVTEEQYSLEQAWRSYFTEYMKLVISAKKKILSDNDLINRRILAYWPNLDVERSLMLSIDRYWGTEEGWNSKKKSRSKKIDMVETLLKNIDKNKVFKKQSNQTDNSDPSHRVIG